MYLRFQADQPLLPGQRSKEFADAEIRCRTRGLPAALSGLVSKTGIQRDSKMRGGAARRKRLGLCNIYAYSESLTLRLFAPE